MANIWLINDWSPAGMTIGFRRENMSRLISRLAHPTRREAETELLGDGIIYQSPVAGPLVCME